VPKATRAGPGRGKKTNSPRGEIVSEKEATGIKPTPITGPGYLRIIRRRREGGEMGTAPEPDWSGWEAWRAGHEDILRQEIIKALDKQYDTVAEALGLLRSEMRLETDRRITVLENENKDLRTLLSEALSRMSEARKTAEADAHEQRAAIAKLERAELTRQVRDRTLIERSDRVSELMRDNAASRAELARQQFDQAFAARDARLRTMEEKFTMLLHFLSLSHDLPRGL